MNRTAMKVRTKLTLAFGALTTLLLVVAALAWTALEHENDAFDRFVHGITVRAHVAIAVRQAVDARAVAARNLVLVSRPEDLAQERVKVEKAHQAVGRELARLQEMGTLGDASDGAHGLIAEIARIEKLYAPVAMNIVSLALSSQREEAIQQMNEKCRPLLAELVQASDALSDHTRQRAEQMSVEGEARMGRDKTRFALVVLTALSVSVVSGILIVRSLRRDLGAEPADLGHAAARVATGDLGLLAGEDGAPRGSVLSSLAHM